MVEMNREDVDERIEHAGPDADPAQKPIFGVAIVMLPDGRIAHSPLDPDGSGVQRKAEYVEALNLCRLLLMSHDQQQVVQSMLQRQGPQLVVPKNGGNPMMNGLRALKGRLGR